MGVELLLFKDLVCYRAWLAGAGAITFCPCLTGWRGFPWEKTSHQLHLPHFHLPTTVLPLPHSPGQQAGSGCCLLELCSQRCPELCRQECGHRHFHCCKSDLKFKGDLCTQLSESRMILGKPVIYSTSLVSGCCFPSTSKFSFRL